MAFIPFQRYLLVTHLNAYRTKELLQEVIAPPGQDIQLSRRPFRGRLAENAFQISRSAGGSHPFLPIINGQIRDNQIQITMRLKLSTFTYMICGITAVLLMALNMFRTGNNLYAALFSLIIIIAYSLGTSYFRWEVGTGRELLEKVFQRKQK